MDDLRNNPLVQNSVRVLVIIDLCLLVSTLTISGALIAVKKTEVANAGVANTAPAVTYAGVAMGAATLLAAAALPGVLDRAARKRLGGATGEELVARLARAYHVRNIMSVALLEGGAMVNIVAYFLEGRLISLPIAGLLLLAMAMQIPSVDRLARWIASQRQQKELNPTA